jgi:citrate lyase subunit beta/citryl-CoA lyase
MTVGSTAFLPLVETPDALARLPEIAAAQRVAGITLGLEDLTTELGITPDSEAVVPLVASLVVAARAAGVLPLGLAGSIAGFRDLDGFRRVVERSRALGLVGAGCIHPAQVPIVNAGFTPAPQELERARRVVAAYDEAIARGTGAISVDGAMIDVPVAARARALLARFGSTSSPKENP